MTESNYISWKAIVCATAVLIITSLISICCAFAAVVVRAQQPGGIQELLSGPVFQAELMLDGGVLGLAGLMVGYLIGPFIAGYLVVVLARNGLTFNLNLLTVLVVGLWVSGALMSPSGRGITIALLFAITGGLAILSGGKLAIRKRITKRTSGG